MARMDKTDSTVGVTRGTLAANLPEADNNTLVPVGLDANGKVVKGAGISGVIGVTIPGPETRLAGKRVDIFRLGEAVDLGAGFIAGTKYYATTTGTVNTTNTGTYIGFTVEADRLVLAGF